MRNDSGHHSHAMGRTIRVACWPLRHRRMNYFETHRHHMDYPTFRRKGWPIGSGVTESAVKQFNPPKADVKGTEQFWSVPGVETILSLRALWLSQDGRWERYWNTRPAYSKAA